MPSLCECLCFVFVLLCRPEASRTVERSRFHGSAFEVGHDEDGDGERQTARMDLRPLCVHWGGHARGMLVSVLNISVSCVRAWVCVCACVSCVRHYRWFVGILFSVLRGGCFLFVGNILEYDRTWYGLRLLPYARIGVGGSVTCSRASMGDGALGW